jgi:hypothetical protein
MLIGDRCYHIVELSRALHVNLLELQCAAEAMCESILLIILIVSVSVRRYLGICVLQCREKHC